MKRFPLMVASAAIGVALLAGITHELAAKDNVPIPPAGGSCYYYLYTCSYGDTGAWWGGCEPGYPAGMIGTSFARIICADYNESGI